MSHTGYYLGAFLQQRRCVLLESDILRAGLVWLDSAVGHQAKRQISLGEKDFLVQTGT